MVFHTKDGVFRWVSPAAVDVLGWRRVDLVGVRKLDFWHPDDRQVAQASPLTATPAEVPA